MVSAYATGDYTMQEITIFFSVHYDYATISQAVKKHRASMYDCRVDQFLPTL